MRTTRRASLLLAPLAVACAEAPASVDLSPEAERGRQVFLSRSAPACGTCHALADAGSRGRLGPDLDERRPTFDRVVEVVTHGVDLMPAQKGILTPEQIDAVALYVVEATRAPTEP